MDDNEKRKFLDRTAATVMVSALLSLLVLAGLGVYRLGELVF